MRKLCRVMISRYTLCALIILLDLSLLVYLALYAYRYSVAFFAVSAIVTAAILVSLINRDANPEFKITWLVVLLLLPTFGALLYVLFYSRRMSKREARFAAGLYDRIKQNAEGSGDSALSLATLSELSLASRSGAGTAHALLSDDPLAAVASAEGVEYYPSGEEFYDSLLEALRSAERYIFLEYFIIAEGEMWDGIHAVLKERVEAGVEVRVLYDDIGSMSTVPYGFDKRLRAEGILARRFAKVRPTLNSSLQNRDHRKIAVVDGRVAFTGGMNIADEYINRINRFGHWKDGGVKVEGRAARTFTRMFLAQYDLAVGRISEYDRYLPANLSTGADICKENGFVVPFCDGPAPISPAAVGKSLFINVINSASSYVYITTPYLIIDYELTEALRGAVKRGVDVRIITPAAADKRLVKIMTKNSYSYLTKAGVRIFEYSPGFIHEKTLVSDGTVAIVGTINLDYRSLVHHFEDGVFIHSSPVIDKIRDGFFETEAKSREILSDRAKLRLHERIVRDLIRIFAPLL